MPRRIRSFHLETGCVAHSATLVHFSTWLICLWPHDRSAAMRILLASSLADSVAHRENSNSASNSAYSSSPFFSFSVFTKELKTTAAVLRALFWDTQRLNPRCMLPWSTRHWTGSSRFKFYPESFIWLHRVIPLGSYTSRRRYHAPIGLYLLKIWAPSEYLHVGGFVRSGWEGIFLLAE